MFECLGKVNSVVFKKIKFLAHLPAELKTNSIVFKKKFKYLAHQSERYCFKDKQISKSTTSRVKNE